MYVRPSIQGSFRAISSERMEGMTGNLAGWYIPATSGIGLISATVCSLSWFCRNFDLMRLVFRTFWQKTCDEWPVFVWILLRHDPIQNWLDFGRGLYFFFHYSTGLTSWSGSNFGLHIICTDRSSTEWKECDMMLYSEHLQRFFRWKVAHFIMAPIFYFCLHLQMIQVYHTDYHVKYIFIKFYWAAERLFIFSI